MTRLIAEFADERDNVKIHITSLKPIRPDNRPSDWEAIALDAFETGDQEQYSGYYDDGSSLVFRYMAPLITEQSCL